MLPFQALIEDSSAHGRQGESGGTSHHFITLLLVARCAPQEDRALAAWPRRVRETTALRLGPDELGQIRKNLVASDAIAGVPAKG